MIGTNLLFDGISFDIKKLTDEKIGAEFVSYLADKIKMTKVDKPRTFKFPVVEEEEISGYTSIILLAESHISIHTWPEKNLFSIDIFSCNKNFDPKKAEQEIIKFFNVKSYNSQVFLRSIPRQKIEIEIKETE
ncbi:adenosylmethionine decarboxylase [Candidatus Woesearchaeota archaeon]|nr:adenosylmethionine decarboxylase [Candidatus Woesearchaeota archaeon]